MSPISLLLLAAVLSAVMSVYALAADRARALFRSRRAMRAIHRASAAVMAGMAVAVITR